MGNIWMIVLIVLPAGFIYCAHWSDDIGKKVLTKNDAEVQELLDITMICRSEWNVTLQQMQSIETGNFTSTLDVKCYISCYFQHYGTMYQNGTFNLERLKKSMHPYLNKGAVRCEKKLKTVDPCERAFEQYACFIKTLFLDADPNITC